MTAVVLCLLALADASFSGFRAHAGRDGRIAKRGAKALAARTGLIAGAIVLVGLAVLLLGLIAVGAATYDELEHAGERMALIYGLYALVVTVGFAAYFSPWLEVQSLATMLVLGPGTFTRPVVVVGGAAWSAIGGSWIIAACAMVAAGAMLLIEPVLWRWFDARQATTMPPFVPPPTRRFSRASSQRGTSS